MLGLLCSTMRASRNTQKRWKGHARRRRKYRVSVYKLNVQKLSQTPFTKRELQLNEFTR